jgi:hypothetical protein
MERAAEKHLKEIEHGHLNTNRPKDTFWFFFGCFILGLGFFLDAPWGGAFYNYTPITETIGAIYFASFSDSFGLPGISVSPFELLSCILAVAALFKIFPSFIGTSSKNIFIAMLASLTIIFVAGITSGWMHGNNSRLMLTQIRSIITLPLWLIIGTAFFSSKNRAWIFLSIIACSTFGKSLQGFWHYFYVLERRKGSQEYSVEHITSSSIVTALVVINSIIWLRQLNLLKKILISITINPVLVFIFLANDRRAALIGLFMGLGIVLISLPIKFFHRNFLSISAVLLLGVLYIPATWETSGAFGFPARAIKSLMDPNESSSGYRKVENANLLFSVANEPLTGIGFGKRFPVVFPLPNISAIYREYDLVPHNTLLFVWTFAGPLCIAGLGAFFALSLGLALRIWRGYRCYEICFLGGIATIILIQGLAYIYADIGLREVRLLAELGGVSGYLVGLSQLSFKQGDI